MRYLVGEPDGRDLDGFALEKFRPIVQQLMPTAKTTLHPA